MVDIANDRAQADIARWKNKCLAALEANEQFEGRAKGRVSDLARLLGRLARALPSDKANAGYIKELSQLAQALSGRPFDERLNRDIKSGYDQLLNVTAAHESEQACLLAALNEAVAELEQMAGSWLLKRRLKRFRKSLTGKNHPSASQLVGELKDLQSAALKSVQDNVAPEDQNKNEPPAPVVQRENNAADDAPEPGAHRKDSAAEGPGEQAPGADPQSAEATSGPVVSTDWSAVQQVLLHLLERVETVTDTQEQLQDVYKQVTAGIDEQLLIPVLERVRDLFDLSLAGLRGEYRLFLDAVDKRLGGLLSNMETVQSRGEAGIERRQQFNKGIETGFAAMRAQANAAEDIGAIKHSIEDNLQHLGHVLSRYSAESDADSAQSNAELMAMRGRLEELESESKTARKQMEQQRCLAMTDSLTSLPNRRALDERMEHEFAQWQRYKSHLSVALMDIDFFKKVNDTHGHAGGDQALMLIGNIISNRVRQVDFAARFGGEEFAILMSSTTIEQAARLLEHLRRFIEECGFNYQGQHVRITMSIGLTEARAGDDPNSALERADAALYKAKQTGRNRICHA